MILDWEAFDGERKKWKQFAKFRLIDTSALQWRCVHGVTREPILGTLAVVKQGCTPCMGDFSYSPRKGAA